METRPISVKIALFNSNYFCLMETVHYVSVTVNFEIEQSQRNNILCENFKPNLQCIFFIAMNQVLVKILTMHILIDHIFDWKHLNRRQYEI
ncbi:Lens fiber membrane intrinsic protein [Dirofilaria immitis]